MAAHGANPVAVATGFFTPGTRCAAADFQRPVRLTGIDAPEKRQAFGNVSKQSLAEQVAGQSVAVEWVKVDKYGRKVGKVLLLTNRAMQRLRSRPERRSWVYGEMLTQCHPGSLGTRVNHKRMIA
jgi:hypothetical protein